MYRLRVLLKNRVSAMFFPVLVSLFQISPSGMGNPGETSRHNYLVGFVDLVGFVGFVDLVYLVGFIGLVYLVGFVGLGLNTLCRRLSGTCEGYGTDLS
jgi:hypothetical protein